MCIRWRTLVSLIPFAEGGDGGGFAEDVIADLNVQLTYINSVRSRQKPRTLFLLVLFSENSNETCTE